MVRRKTVSGLVLVFVAVLMLTSGRCTGLVKAVGGSIYIRADGSIDPPTAHITTADNVTYAFTSDINQPIVVERHNIIIDGKRHTLQGPGSGNGFDLYGIRGVTINNTFINGFDIGIMLNYSNNNRLTGINLMNNLEGICLQSSSNNIVADNYVQNGSEGIFLYISCRNDTVTENTLVNCNDTGIGTFDSCFNNSITKNSIETTHNYDNGYGITVGLYDYDEIITGNSIKSVRGIGLQWSYNDVVTGNNITSQVFGVGLIGSNNTIVTKNNIVNNTDPSTGIGVALEDSNNNVVTENNIVNNTGPGMYIVGSCNNSIKENHLKNNTGGILLGSIDPYFSSDNSVVANDITDSYGGIGVSSSSHDLVANNNVKAGPPVPNTQTWGIQLWGSNSTSLIGNSIEEYFFGVQAGTYDSSLTGNIITGNTYGLGFQGINSTMAGNDITGNTYGIYFGAFNSTIAGNNIENNVYGIYQLSFVSYGFFNSGNFVVGNNITGNNFGVWLDHVNGTMFYHNNFVGNTNHAVSTESWNLWDNGYPSGGNYWSDYADVDKLMGPGQSVPGSDGIWDRPYIIDGNNIDDYPLVNSWVPKTCLAVRGMDSRIYYRTGNGADWQGWNVLPGSTMDSPAAAMLGNQLHFVVRGADGNSLWHGYLTNPSDPASFSGWNLLGGAASSAPTLASNGTVLCLVVRGLDNRIYFRCYRYGYAWGVWHAVPTGATCDSPAAAMLGNNLHIVVRGMDQSSLWDIIVRCDGTVVRNWGPLSGATPSKPVLASSGVNNLYLAVRGMDGTIYYRNYTALTDSWADWSAFPTGATNDGPAATVMGNMLCTVVRGLDGNTLWYADVNLDTSSFTGWTLISGATPSAPTLTS